jgi:hypothetical protein
MECQIKLQHKKPLEIARKSKKSEEKPKEASRIVEALKASYEGFRHLCLFTSLHKQI